MNSPTENNEAETLELGRNFTNTINSFATGNTFTLSNLIFSGKVFRKAIWSLLFSIPCCLLATDGTETKAVSYLVCGVTDITTVTQRICDPLSNTYAQEVTVIYADAPASGDLIVNSQSFPITSSPQTVTLTNLAADGNPVDVTAFFADAPACSLEVNALFTAPSSIPSVDVGPDQNVCREFVSLTASITGSTGPYDISWFPSGQTTPTSLFLANETAEHTATVIDNFGCTVSDKVLLNVTGITDVDAIEQTACNSFFNTFTQTLEVSYIGAPATGSLSVNGQLFPIETSPQTVTLVDIIADGDLADVSIFFTDAPSCVFVANNVYRAPVGCDVDCDIMNVTVGNPYNCNPISDTYNRDVLIYYEGTDLTGSLEVLVNGQGGFIPYPIQNTNPQAITLSLPSDGEENIDIFVRFSDVSGCTYNAQNLFSNPRNCSGVHENCDITGIAAGVQICNQIDDTYDQEIILTYEDAPNTGSILVKVDNGGWLSFPIGSSPQRIMLEDLSPSRNAVNVFAKFSDDNSCTINAPNLFTAPANCIATATLEEILFLVRDANNLNNGDTEIRSRLEALGHTVSIVNDDRVIPEDAVGKRLILISNSVSANQIGDMFSNTAVGLINFETFLFDDLGMTASGDFGHDNGETQVLIQFPVHPLAAGLTGYVDVLNRPGSLAYGFPSASAIVAASTDGNVSQATVFGYEAGASMVRGSAPARRVGIFFKDNQIRDLTDDGWALFDAAVCWAMGCVVQGQVGETPPPLRAYPNPFTDEITIEWEGEDNRSTIELSVRNLLGREMYKRQLRAHEPIQLSFPNLPEGVYYLVLSGDGIHMAKRIIKP